MHRAKLVKLADEIERRRRTLNVVYLSRATKNSTGDDSSALQCRVTLQSGRWPGGSNDLASASLCLAILACIVTFFALFPKLPAGHYMIVVGAFLSIIALAGMASLATFFRSTVRIDLEVQQGGKCRAAILNLYGKHLSRPRRNEGGPGETGISILCVSTPEPNRVVPTLDFDGLQVELRATSVKLDGNALSDDASWHALCRHLVHDLDALATP